MNGFAAVGKCRHILAGVAVPSLLVACGAVYVAPPVTSELVNASPAPMSRIERGYAIHQAKCAKCHSFENPADYDVDELRHDIMPVMARKSKLTDADSDAILAYLLAARQMPVQTP